MPDSTGEGQVDSCSLLIISILGAKIVSSLSEAPFARNLFDFDWPTTSSPFLTSNPFCEDFPSLPVEEWRAKLGQGRKLFLWVHDKSMSWNYCTRRALAYNDEPEKGEGDQGELRDDNEKPVFKKYKKGLKVQQ